MVETLQPPSTLPYRPAMREALGPVRTSFRVINRGMAPALRAGLGALVSNPLTGYLMLLRTRGRRTGALREVPLGYVIRGGDLYCAAGFGSATPWLLNIEADPIVEVVLPGRTLRGIASRVSDPVEWTAAYRALIASYPLVGRLMLGDIGRLDDAALFARHASIPVVRIHPTAFVPGAFDPGGRGWLAVVAVEAELALLGAWLWRRRGARRS